VNIDISHIKTERLSYAAWKAMWLDYLSRRPDPVPPEQHQLTYSRLVDPDFNLFGVVAGSAEPVGFAYFYFHPSSFHAHEDCCLQDLYVHPGARGRGLGRALVEQVATMARTRGASVLHWRTRESNVTAQSMYARFAERTEFVSFRLPL
jgi:GNAT superfamily N-acetyltransferase